MKRTTKRVLSFVLAILMVASTMFTGTIEAKADTGTIYEPYYNAETGKVVDAPAVGTVLKPEDIIKGDNLADNVIIQVCVHALKEEISENAYGYSIYRINKGEQKLVSEMRTVLDTGETGFTVAAVDTYEMGLNRHIEICVYANDGPEKVENIVIDLDWSKFEAEIGGLLDTKNFKDGFIKNDKFTAKVGFDLGMIYVTSPDGTEKIYDGRDEVIINETDSYKVNAIFILKDGYYVEVNDEVVVNDETVKDGAAKPYTGQSHYWTTRIVVPIDFGTGAEMVERVKNANQAIVPPTSGEEDQESVTPPAEAEDKNDYSAKLENESDVASKIELTDAEKEAIANGEKLEVVLSFKDAGTTATTEEQKAIEKELGNKKVGTFLEIDLSKKVGTIETAVSKTTGLIAVTFELPKELVNTNDKVDRTYSVMRYHDGKVDILDAKYNAEKGTITFETDKFSTYAVVYEDTAVETVPKTGDTTNVAMYVMLFICGVGLLVVLRKQNRI